jgi:hypothetical protein
MKDNQRTKSSKSPIRKQLTKKMINYFDQLDEAKAKERSASRKRSNSRKAPLSKSSVFEIEKKIEYYEDTEQRKKKLEDLKHLMKKELTLAQKEGTTEPPISDIYKSMSGYPSFIKPEKVPTAVKNLPFIEPVLNQFKKGIHQILEERVQKAMESEEGEEKGPEEDSPRKHNSRYLRSSEDIYDEELYHLETEKVVVPHNKVEENQFDHHQRKSKEIRRLQYASTIGGPKRKHKKQEVFESLVVSQEEEPKPVETRTSPEEGYPVWIRFKLENGRKKVVPALLKNVIGFKLNPETQSMEVKEKDDVIVVPRVDATEEEKFPQIGGLVEKPNPRGNPDEDDCELIVQTPSYLRYPILIFEREEEVEPIPEIVSEDEPKLDVIPQPITTRMLEDPNCSVYDIIGKFLGRGRLSLEKLDRASGQSIKYAKGILLNSEGNLECVLVKRFNERDLALKKKSLQVSNHKVESQETINLVGVSLQCLNIIDEDTRSYPELLFMLDGEFLPQNEPYFEGEEAQVEMEDCHIYEGNLKVGHGKNNEQLWLVVHPNEENVRNVDFGHGNTGTFGAKGNSIVQQDMLRVELDEVDPDQDISNLLDKIKGLLDARKPAPAPVRERTEAYTFEVRSPDGRRLKIYFKPKEHGEGVAEEVDASFEGEETNGEEDKFEVEIGEKTVVAKQKNKKRGRKDKKKLDPLENYDIDLVQYETDEDREARLRREAEKREEEKRLWEEMRRQMELKLLEEEERRRRLAEEAWRKLKDEEDERLRQEALKREREAQAEQERINRLLAKLKEELEAEMRRMDELRRKRQEEDEEERKRSELERERLRLLILEEQRRLEVLLREDSAVGGRRSGQ